MEEKLSTEKVIIFRRNCITGTRQRKTCRHLKGMVNIMQERRRSKRTELQAKLLIKRLDDGTFQEVAITVMDLSKTGIGFSCEEALRINAVYESHLTIWTKEVLHCFLQISRIELESSGFSYGAIFIGMTEMDAARIQVYQTVNDGGDTEE